MTETTAAEAARDLAIVRRGRAVAHSEGVVAELRVGALLGAGKCALARTAYVDDVVATTPLLPDDVAVAGAFAGLPGVAVLPHR